MDEDRKAIKFLLSNNYIVSPNSKTVFRNHSDPMALAKKFIETFSTDIKCDEFTLTKLINNTNQSSTPNYKVKIQPPISRKIPTIKKKYTINTKIDDLTDLHNYEPKFSIIQEPILSDNLVGDLNDMVGYFQNRYKKLSNILKRRADLSNFHKINEVKKEQNNISVIGMLSEKTINSENSAQLILEDPHNEKILEVIVSDPILVEQATQIMLDSVICVKGNVNQKGMFFATHIILPDIPSKPISSQNYADETVHVAFLSDIHVGSKGFLDKPMDKFIDFLNGKGENLHLQKLGKNTKYVMFSGDVVDGVGIYPGQLDELAMDSIHDQYDAFGSFLERIPEDVQMVVIPGNHDMVRSAEPQPKIPERYAPTLSKMENVHLLPNPSQVSLHGVNTLLYHCTSLPDMINNIPGMQIDKPIEVMINMLKARHLAPMWGSKTPLATEPEDHLVIDPIPDIFHGGHVHINGYGKYKGVQIVNSGTMQAQTSFQKSLNIDPTPGQVTLLNLKTRIPSQLDFM